VVTLFGALSACDSSRAVGTPSGDIRSVSCGNYRIHANGKSYYEVSVHVDVHNSTGRSAVYVVDVEMDPRPAGRTSFRHRDVAVRGSVSSQSSAELGHKVLTTYAVTCKVARVSRS
jgi:hypothetical protein